MDTSSAEQTGKHLMEKAHPQQEAQPPVIDIPAEIFRAYDIRGLVGSGLNPDNIAYIGLAIGQMMMQADRQRIVFGADARLSSPLLTPPLQQGLRAAGCDVVDLGCIPTPLLYYATHITDCDSGVMLTASHNPADYNGIKIVLGRHCLDAEQIRALHQAAVHAARSPLPAPQGRLLTPPDDIQQQYIGQICREVRLARPVRVIVDCGNAVPGLVAPDLLTALGCEVTGLYCEPDGHFPNHHPDPTISENLQDLIAALHTSKADLGIAFDGDGDRVVIVSSSGRVVDTDRLLMLMLPQILRKYDSPAVIFDVKCSHLLRSAITALGGRPIMSRSGHSFMKQRMLETGAVIGAEFSAHVFIRDRWFGHDDGLYVAARFIEQLASTDSSVDQLLDTLPASYSTPEIRLGVAEARKFALMETISQRVDFCGAQLCLIDGIRADYADGWGLIRASNTTPALLLRFEASNVAALQRIMQQFVALLARVEPALSAQLAEAGVYWADFFASN